MLGLTLAHRLAGQGHEVTVVEAAPDLGGLASAWQLGDLTWDRHYHVVLPSDSHTRGILAELGLDSEVRWVPTRTGYHVGGRRHPATTPAEFLRLPGLDLVTKARIAATILLASRIQRWERLEPVDVATWLRRWSGRRGFERFWLPQLRAKLGESYRDVSATFVWATIQRLAGTRRSGLERERLGYVPGGYARVLDRFASVLAGEGVTIETARPVARIESSGGTVRVIGTDGAEEEFDDVVVTAAAPLAARLCPGLGEGERARLEAVRYQGIVCASLLLREPLDGQYLTYIADDVPFTTVVEMSALVDPAELGGRGLVYLPKYVASDDPFLEVPDDQIADRFVTALCELQPGLTPDDVLCLRISRVRHVFALPTPGFSARVPPVRTSVPGVWLVSSANVVNGTLNVDETVALAERAARMLVSTGRGVTTVAG